ncbi:hypothetical protein DRO31_02655 [Candidatus Bathyarchaeota archaeon]|nr:hypothetical protein [archaeon]RLI03082.1 MAG: hypothetical protein DRO31_02655 [Candidatus Bathyarchaeota archaeon]
MAIVKRLRADQVNRLVRTTKDYAESKNKKITTIDPILRVGKNIYPTLTNRELIELSQTALRIILNEVEAPTYQTTLFAHI